MHATFAFNIPQRANTSKHASSFHYTE